MASIGDVFLRILADANGFEADIVKRAGPASDKAGETLGQRLGNGIKKNMSAIVGGVMGGLGAVAIKMGDTVDDAYDRIRAGTGATGEALQGLKDDFAAVAGRVPEDLGVIGQVIADLNTRTGQTGQGLQDLATKILELSRLTRTDAVTNVQQATRVFGDWSIATQDQGDALDALFRASQATGVSINTLMTNIVTYGAPMRQLGFSFDQAAALIGKFEKEGVNSELVLGSLRISLGKMAKAGEPAVETFQRMVDEIKNAGSTSQANAKALELFGARAGPDMAAAIREGRFDLGALFDQVSAGGETIDKATADTSGFDEQLKEFANTVKVKVGPAFTVFSGFSQTMGPLLYSLPMLGAGFGKLAGAVAKGILKLIPQSAAAATTVGTATGAAEGTAQAAALAATAPEQAAAVVSQGPAVEAAAATVGAQAGGKLGTAISLGIKAGVLVGAYSLGSELASEAPKFKQVSHETLKVIGDLQAGIIDLHPFDPLVHSADDLIKKFGDVKTKVENTKWDQAFDGLPTAATNASQQAITIMGATPGEIAKAWHDGRQTVNDEFDQLVTDLKNQLTPAQEKAQIIGKLSSKELAAGLKSGDPMVKAEAQQLRQDLLDELNKIDGRPAGEQVVDDLTGALASREAHDRAEWAARDLVQDIINQLTGKATITFTIGSGKSGASYGGSGPGSESGGGTTSGGGSSQVPGSGGRTAFASGLDFVPYNNFPASLHYGEAILTKPQADQWRAGSQTNVNVSVQGLLRARNGLELAYQMQRLADFGLLAPKGGEG
jgi:hypothetical protein